MTKKNTTYIFLRHSKLQLPYKDHGEMPFSVLSKLGLQELNPPIDMPYTIERLKELESVISLLDVEAIYTSSSQRTIDTGAVICDQINKAKHSEIKCTILPNLKEIYFDLEKLGSVFDGEAMMKEKGIHGANFLVFKGMVSGTHAEQVKEAYERVGKLFDEIKKLGEGTFIFITHDFFMRVIELYIHRKGGEYAPITVKDLETTKRNTYLTGFSTDESFSTFSII